ncbi:hypothetical protein CTI12_AA033850 [Artemisia annua]|uniref:Uncharacterized protein n=1 Tax=Artemisia annua TaxID=35608 RepID=A0A2U1QG76_ARTAN|nr:hypothetical protein CTI12_AA033850 [Artemisia annua]
MSFVFCGLTEDQCRKESQDILLMPANEALLYDLHLSQVWRGMKNGPSYLMCSSYQSKEMLVAKTTQLETEKKQKETEIQKLMDENIRLNALVDKKEAQLLAMHEQCKVMALSASNI